MSTAWYKSGVIPTLQKKWHGPSHRTKQSIKIVEVWSTTCIVTNFGKSVFRKIYEKDNSLDQDDGSHHVLINPTNPKLTGVSTFPYFPRGGPEPKDPPNKDSHPIMGYVTTWGGMEVGRGMMFPANIVDGLVHQLGGWRLARELLQVQPHSSISKMATSINNVKCPEGRAICTGPGTDSELAMEYDAIVHTVPPFFNHPPVVDDGIESEALLRRCYQEALHLATTSCMKQQYHQNNAQHSVGTIRIACPLLGAGCRGFPTYLAIQAAVEQAIEWQKNSSNVPCDDNNGLDCNENSNLSGNKQRVILAFGIPDSEIAKQLIIAMDAER